jgi:glycolate oxidase FAD binding subunit
MSSLLTPTSTSDLIEAVRSTPRLLAVGAGTKPRLSALDAVKISTTQLCGIIEYEPTEFTFTAMAGTRVQDIIAALSARGQYLPFDPMLVAAGATLGGTVAAGLSGPGRFRFGGVRDFILGVQFIDGTGRLLRMGGKVVKNAAGFDLPKFFVGSLGRFGVLIEMTFKVFPTPASTLTLKLAVNGPEPAARMMTEAANARWELDALDLLPGGNALCLRLAGPAEALKKISTEILARSPGETLSPEQAELLWSEIREFTWAHADSPLVKIPLTPLALPALTRALDSITGVRLHISAGGNQAFVSLPTSTQFETLDKNLQELGLSAMTLRGNCPLWCGAHTSPRIAASVKHALDPNTRYPSLDD